MAKLHHVKIRSQPNLANRLIVIKNSYLQPLPFIRRAILLFLGIYVASLSPLNAAAAEDGEPSGAVVVLEDDASTPFQLERSQLPGASFQVYSLTRTDEAITPEPTSAMAQLLGLYQSASFIECLDRQTSGDLNLGTMLQNRQRAAAGQVSTLTAACAEGAGERTRAHRILISLFAVGIDPTPWLAGTTPDFQTQVEAARLEAASLPRAVLHIRVRPAGARLWLDGRPVQCASTTCNTAVLTGEHFLAARQLGFHPLQTQVQVSSDRSLDLTMEPSTSAEARAQLQTWSSSSTLEPDRIALIGALAFELPVVVFTWRDAEGGHAVLYDKRVNRIVSRTHATGTPHDREAAVRTAVQQWQTELGPRHLARNPWLWLGVGATIAAGVGMFFLLRNPGERFNIEVSLENQ